MNLDEIAGEQNLMDDDFRVMKGYLELIQQEISYMSFIEQNKTILPLKRYIFNFHKYVKEKQ